MKVKICGITHREDAKLAAESGADFIGIIFARGSKRQVTIETAKEIAQAARLANAVPVGVFVEESVEEIIDLCDSTQVKTVQLHRQLSEEELRELQSHFSVICAIPVRSDGTIESMHELPHDVTALYDFAMAGSGKSFDWKAFSPPKDIYWVLAGGLNPENVALAIGMLHPGGVDVATGVEMENSRRKDPALVKKFIRTAKEAEEKL